MEFEKYTDRAKGFLQSAQTMALRHGHQRLTPEHLLKVLLAERGLKPEFKPFGLKMGDNASDMKVCGGLTPEQQKKLEAIKKDLLDGKIKTLES